MITTPKAIIKKIGAIIYQFIWNLPDKVKRIELCADYHEGGLKMIDVITRIRTHHFMWLKRYVMMQSKTGWPCALNHYVDKIGGIDLLLKCNFDIKKLNIHIPPFYADILNTFAHVNGHIIGPMSLNDICQPQKQYTRRSNDKRNKTGQGQGQLKNKNM